MNIILVIQGKILLKVCPQKLGWFVISWVPIDVKYSSSTRFGLAFYQVLLSVPIDWNESVNNKSRKKYLSAILQRQVSVGLREILLF